MLVRKLRLRKGWSQERLALLTDLSVRTIQRAEQGLPQSLETRNALAAIFEVDVSIFDQESFMTDENEALKAEEVRVLQYVQGIKAFYQHVLLFMFMALLFVGGIYLVHGFVPVMLQFALVGWAFGLVFHGLTAFEIINFFGPVWERRQVEMRLGRKL